MYLFHNWKNPRSEVYVKEEWWQARMHRASMNLFDKKFNTTLNFKFLFLGFFLWKLFIFQIPQVASCYCYMCVCVCVNSFDLDSDHLIYSTEAPRLQGLTQLAMNTTRE